VFNRFGSLIDFLFVFNRFGSRICFRKKVIEKKRNLDNEMMTLSGIVFCV